MNTCLKLIFQLFLVLIFSNPLHASEFNNLEKVLNNNFKLIVKSSSRTIEPVIEDLLNTKSTNLEEFLKSWKNKKLYYVKKSKLIAILKQKNSNDYELLKFSDKTNLGFFKKKEIKAIKPTSVVRSKISNALIGFQLLNDDPNVRSKSLETLTRQFNAKYLIPLKNALKKENNQDLKKRMSELLVFGPIKYSQNENEKILSLIHI